MFHETFTNLSEKDSNKLLKETHNRNEGLIISHLEELKNRNPNFHWSWIKYRQTGESIIHVAARLGRLQTIEHLLTEYKPSGVDCKTNDDKTALHEASQFGQTTIVCKLLEFGADVNALKRADWTPLMLACTKTCPETVRILLESGALVDCRNKDGWTCLHLATRAGNSEIVELLLSQSEINVAEVTCNNRTLLHIAALHGHVDIVKMLLNIPNLRALINSKDGCGNTALFEAAMNGNSGICKLLISQGADPYLSNDLGYNILHLVASNGDELCEPMVSFILDDLKICIDSINRNGFSPLHCAARKKSLEIYKFLVDRGADEYLKDACGRTPLDYLNS